MRKSLIDEAFLAWRNSVNSEIPHPLDRKRLACLARTIARYGRKSEKYNQSWFIKMIESTKDNNNDGIRRERAEEFYSQLELMILAAKTPPYPDKNTRKYFPGGKFWFR